MSNPVTSWTSLGMDWNRPSPDQSKYYEACRLALMERYLWAGFVSPDNRLYQPIYENAFGSLKSYTYLEILEACLNNDSFLSLFMDIENFERIQDKTLVSPDYIANAYSSASIRSFLYEDVPRFAFLIGDTPSELIQNIQTDDEVYINNIPAVILGYVSIEDKSYFLTDAVYLNIGSSATIILPAPFRYFSTHIFDIEYYPLVPKQDIEIRLKNIKEKIQKLNYFYYDIKSYIGVVEKRVGTFEMNYYKEHYWGWGYVETEGVWKWKYFDRSTDWVPWRNQYPEYYANYYYEKENKEHYTYRVRRWKNTYRNVRIFNSFVFPYSTQTYRQGDTTIMVYYTSSPIPLKSITDIDFAVYRPGKQLIELSDIADINDFISQVLSAAAPNKLFYFYDYLVGKNNYKTLFISVQKEREIFNRPILTSDSNYFYANNIIRDDGILAKINSVTGYVGEIGGEGKHPYICPYSLNASSCLPLGDITIGDIDDMPYLGDGKKGEYGWELIPVNWISDSFTLNANPDNFKINFNFK